MKQPIENIAVIGTGVIGAGWIIRFLFNQKKICVYDPQLNKNTYILWLLPLLLFLLGGAIMRSKIKI